MRRFRQEKDTEAYLCRKVKMLKGLCIKINSPNMAGIPDRLVLLSRATPAFVEVKAFGKKPRPLQKACMQQIRDVHAPCGVYVVDSRSAVDDLIVELTGGEVNGVQTVPISESGHSGD